MLSALLLSPAESTEFASKDPEILQVQGDNQVNVAGESTNINKAEQSGGSDDCDIRTESFSNATELREIFQLGPCQHGAL